MKDYRDIERGLRMVADRFSTNASNKYSPFAKLKGKNFMTPSVVSIRKLENGIWFELSYGRGFLSEDQLLGVTLMDNKGNNLEDISGCCHELSEVEEKLTEASNI